MTSEKKPKTSTSVFPIPHYVCTGGCKFYSEVKQNCPTQGCPRARNVLTICECTDGKHGNLLNLNNTKIPR